MICIFTDKDAPNMRLVKTTIKTLLRKPGKMLFRKLKTYWESLQEEDISFVPI
jgi:hypothetical protein